MDMSTRRTPLRVAALIMLLIATITAIFPLVWIVISSYKTNTDFLLHPFSLPRVWTVENYVNAWERSDFSQYFLNSVIVAAISLTVMLGTGTMVAFALSRFRRILYSPKVLFFFIIGQMISGQVIIISIYLTLTAYRLADSYLGLAMVYAASGLPFVIFMLSGFFRSISFELYEAGSIDGFSDWGVFYRIALPLAKPAIATAFITQFLYVWNEFTIAYITTKSPGLFTVPVGIFQTVNNMYSTSYTAACAGLVITGVPPLLVYAIFQKQIVFGISAGAVKG
jgi:raffinose/stachyose/melibiose transport system permease protein